MKPMNFIEWLRYQQSLLEINMDTGKEYTNGLEKPSKELTATANKIVAKNPDIVNKMTKVNPQQSYQTAMKVVAKNQPHMNVNKRSSLQVGDIAKAVGDVAGIKPEV